MHSKGISEYKEPEPLEDDDEYEDDDEDFNRVGYHHHNYDNLKLAKSDHHRLIELVLSGVPILLVNNYFHQFHHL